ncbi:hypothetical protein [Paenibacillus amylolyticus]|uniref:hypothetical protein n=1 Tax=Paenibacillus amylolyticus TaxID=1451 RepID=UPI003D8079C9
MAEMIVGLSKSNAEMRTTLRYLDQIQRSTERLGRVRYQSLIKVNNELRTTGRRLEHVYSMAVRISRLRITPTIGLIDKLSPALDRAWAKLNSFRDQMVTASGTVSLEVRQKIEVAMGKSGPVGPSMAIVIQNNKNITNATKEEETKGFWEKVSGVAEIINNINDAIDNIIDKVGKFINLFKKKKKKVLHLIQPEVQHPNAAVVQVERWAKTVEFVHRMRMVVDQIVEDEITEVVEGLVIVRTGAHHQYPILYLILRLLRPIATVIGEAVEEYEEAVD